MWSAAGLPVAARRFLGPSEQPSNGETYPRLMSGTVTSVHLESWHSDNDFVVTVEFDLRFKGNPAAWNNGTNTRFVTASRASAAAPLRYEFATGP